MKMLLHLLAQVTITAPAAKLQLPPHLLQKSHATVAGQKDAATPVGL